MSSSRTSDVAVTPFTGVLVSIERVEGNLVTDFPVESAAVYQAWTAALTRAEQDVRLRVNGHPKGLHSLAGAWNHVSGALPQRITDPFPTVKLDTRFVSRRGDFWPTTDGVLSKNEPVLPAREQIVMYSKSSYEPLRPDIPYFTQRNVTVLEGSVTVMYCVAMPSDIPDDLPITRDVYMDKRYTADQWSRMLRFVREHAGQIRLLKKGKFFR